MKYVIDSSAVFPAYVAESLSAKAIALRDDFHNAVHELLAPDLLPIELSNAFIVAERRKRIATGEATKLQDSQRRVGLVPRLSRSCLSGQPALQGGERGLWLGV